MTKIKTKTYFRLFLILCTFGLIQLFSFIKANDVHAVSDNDILLETLVDKGYLTPVEARIVQERTETYVNKHREEGRLDSLPRWVQMIKLKGDLRLRSQYENRKDFDEVYQRGRLRYRLGLIAKMTKQIRIGAGLASGSGDPRSTNVTFENSFQKPDIRLDYAFAEYEATTWLKMIGGKYPTEDYLWSPTDLLWDSDINPEGASLHLEKSLTRQIDPFLNAGVWIIDDLSTQPDDPAVFYAQPGIKFDNDTIDLTLTGNFYYFNNLKGRRLDNTACSNSGLTPFGTSCVGTLTYEYKNEGYSIETGFRKLFNEEYKRIAIFGEYTENKYALKKLKKGWAFGGKFGDLELKYPGQWQVKYQYSYLERDAFPDILPNSDRYEGETNIEGHKVSLTYAFNEYVFFGMNYYSDKKIRDEVELPQSLVQGDITFKF